MWNNLTVEFSQPIIYVGFASTDTTNCRLKILKKKKKKRIQIVPKSKLEFGALCPWWLRQ